MLPTSRWGPPSQPEQHHQASYFNLTSMNSFLWMQNLPSLLTSVPQGEAWKKTESERHTFCYVEKVATFLLHQITIWKGLRLFIYIHIFLERSNQAKEHSCFSLSLHIQKGKITKCMKKGPNSYFLYTANLKQQFKWPQYTSSKTWDI